MKIVKKFIATVLCLAIMAAFLPTVAAAAVTATPTSSKVTVNGKNIEFSAYNIGGNNYFKLRDIAFALNGTAKQFEVGWDSTKNAITLTSGKAYTKVGGEMAIADSGSKNAAATTAKIYLNGKEVNLTAYNIGGNNYFKLRDVGAAFDFGVDWDSAANTIAINTGKHYTPESKQYTIIVNDIDISSKLQIKEINGVVYAEAKSFIESIGETDMSSSMRYYNYEYYPENEEICITSWFTDVEMYSLFIDSPLVYKYDFYGDYELLKIDEVPLIVDGKVYIPVKEFADMTGGHEVEIK